MAQSWLPGAAAEKVRLLEQNGMPLEQRKAAEDITAKVNTASEMVTFNRRTNKRDEEFLGGKSPMKRFPWGQTSLQICSAGLPVD